MRVLARVFPRNRLHRKDYVIRICGNFRDGKLNLFESELGGNLVSPKCVQRIIKRIFSFVSARWCSGWLLFRRFIFLFGWCLLWSRRWCRKDIWRREKKKDVWIYVIVNEVLNFKIFMTIYFVQKHTEVH